jgi:hypothetical protein
MLSIRLQQLKSLVDLLLLEFDVDVAKVPARA